MTAVHHSDNAESRTEFAGCAGGMSAVVSVLWHSAEDMALTARACAVVRNVCIGAFASPQNSMLCVFCGLILRLLLAGNQANRLAFSRVAGGMMALVNALATHSESRLVAEQACSAIANTCQGITHSMRLFALNLPCACMTHHRCHCSHADTPENIRAFSHCPQGARALSRVLQVHKDTSKVIRVALRALDCLIEGVRVRWD